MAPLFEPAPSSAIVSPPRQSLSDSRAAARALAPSTLMFAPHASTAATGRRSGPATARQTTVSSLLERALADRSMRANLCSLDRSSPSESPKATGSPILTVPSKIVPSLSAHKRHADVSLCVEAAAVSDDSARVQQRERASRARSFAGQSWEGSCASSGEISARKRPCSGWLAVTRPGSEDKEDGRFAEGEGRWEGSGSTEGLEKGDPST